MKTLTTSEVAKSSFAWTTDDERRRGNGKFNYRQSKDERANTESEERQNNLWKERRNSAAAVFSFTRPQEFSTLVSRLLSGNNIQIYLSIYLLLLNCSLRSFLSVLAADSAAVGQLGEFDTWSYSFTGVSTLLSPPVAAEGADSGAGGAVRQECQFAGREGEGEGG